MSVYTLGLQTHHVSSSFNAASKARSGPWKTPRGLSMNANSASCLSQTTVRPERASCHMRKYKKWVLPIPTPGVGIH